MTELMNSCRLPEFTSFNISWTSAGCGPKCLLANVSKSAYLLDTLYRLAYFSVDTSTLVDWNLLREVLDVFNAKRDTLSEALSMSVCLLVCL